MGFEPGKRENVLTKDIQKRISRIALERMQQEYESDFQLLSQFRTLGVRNFLAWIRRVAKPQQEEAALSITFRYLLFHRVKCRIIPNYERWHESYSNLPLNTGLDYEWHRNRHGKTIASLVKKTLQPLHMLSPRSFDLANDNPLAIPAIRCGLELSTNRADIILLQFVRGDLSLLDLSYVSLLGLGPTGWRVYEKKDCAKVVAQLPAFIAKVKDLV
jgi:hypothetical protein